MFISSITTKNYIRNLILTYYKSIEVETFNINLLKIYRNIINLLKIYRIIYI